MFNPATPLHHLDHVMDRLDVILLMSVNPGFGGQSFIPETLNKLRAVRPASTPMPSAPAAPSCWKSTAA